MNRWIICEKESKLPYSSFLAAYEASCKLNELESDVPIDEMECLLANLIDKGYMKGYLSQERQFVVLSKVDPFPALNTIS